MISSEKKAEIVAKYGKDAKDTGSPKPFEPVAVGPS